ncbi:hypothetical protein A5844_000916 [Enterococcus sp. 10A9_DIV0425]|uniref:Uncharacterized protein n=1 Tax=Candidatus Enterococcus wittei TaxID=1987383 RepID=A0A242JZZ3_9ENTE|nr:DUF916 domain-containing protein [Enterococcus sp. 10A9_DIV0425]OTP10782.1 hypothetical protein A5844_000916 [Enterococcus sp. 10A9_DIV0425]THE10785.1 DUF916 domain-containing protein [Enterococcus hirae]
MNLKTICLTGIALFLVLPSLIIGKEVEAEENDSVGFSVSPIFNEAQNKESNFFDLTVVPDSVQEIGVIITNQSTEESSYEIQIAQASTNKNGVIDYSNMKGTLAKTVPFIISEQASFEVSVKVPAGESKTVPIKINIPKNSFTGEVLGGINVTKDLPEKKASQITNQFSYVIGLRMREREENPERNLVAGDISPTVVFGGTGIEWPITNDRSVSMGKLQVDSVLKREGKEVAKETYTDREIAPDSVYPYSLKVDKKDYVPGKYELNVVISDVQGNRWEFNEAFELSEKEVKAVSEAAIQPQEDSSYLLWVLIIIFIVIILLLLIYIIMMKRRNKKQIEE